MAELPLYEVVVGANGQPVYCIEIAGQRVCHQQLWQCEVFIQQIASDRGIELPTDWMRRELGHRTRPQS